MYFNVNLIILTKVINSAFVGIETTEGKRSKLKENCVVLITMEELETTIKTLNTRKSPGFDGIINELYKYASKYFYIFFLNFLNVCWIYGDIPEEWRTAIVIPIHRKGDRNNPDNYRGISLLNTGYKIYSKIIFIFPCKSMYI